MSRAGEPLTLPNLPFECWDKVIVHLSLEERKNARLTCRHFYEACNSDKMHENELFIFRGNINSCAALQSLSATKRKVWHITLHRVHLEDTCIYDFFDRQGINVHSLTFSFCSLAPDIFKSIINYCENLQDIMLIFDSVPNDESCSNLFDNLEALQENRIVRRSVTSFTLKVPDNFVLTNGQFLNIFKIFPNIRSLRLTIEIDQHFSARFNPFCDLNSAISFHCLCDQLFVMREQIEKLHLHLTNSSSMSKFCALIQGVGFRIAAAKMENLVELSLNWMTQWNEVINTPMLPVKHLTHVDCILRQLVLPIERSNFIKSILDAVPTLKTLVVRTRDGYRLENQCFQALLRSQLTTLNFRLTNTESDRDDVDTYKSSVILGFDIDRSFWRNVALFNYTLKDLFLNTDDRNLMPLFSTYFRNLETSVIEELRKDALSNIFQFQTQLRSLVLYNCDMYPHESCHNVKLHTLRKWFKDFDLISDCQLPHLTHLHIVEESSLDLSEFVLTRFTFPQLKSIKIATSRTARTQWKGSNFGQLSTFIQKLPQLESVDIRCECQTTFRQWLDLFSALPKLRYFVILAYFYPFPFCDEQYRYCFRTHPTLRSICVLKPIDSKQACSGDVFYYRDTIRDSIEKRSITDKHFPEVAFEEIPVCCP